jgi:hypothetical protein
MRKGNAKEVSSPERVRHPSVRKSPTFFRHPRNAGCGHRASRSDMPECCMRALRRPLIHAGMGVRAAAQIVRTCRNGCAGAAQAARHAGMGVQRRSEPFHLPNQCPPPASAATRRRNRCALAMRQPLVHHRTSAPGRDPASTKPKANPPSQHGAVRGAGDGVGAGISESVIVRRSADATAGSRRTRAAAGRLDCLGLGGRCDPVTGARDRRLLPSNS